MPLFLTAFALNLIVFLLALSKGAIFAFLCGMVLYVLLNLSNAQFRKRVLFFVPLGVIVSILGLFAYQMVTGTDFFELMQRRMDQTGSFDWRTKVWDYLLTEMDTKSFFVGHGLTAANALLFQLADDPFHKHEKPLILIHNAYLQLMYDMGILGLCYFVTVLSVIKTAAIRLWRKTTPVIRGFYISMLIMTVFMMIMCSVDEVLSGFDALIVYFEVMAIFTAMVYRELKGQQAV